MMRIGHLNDLTKKQNMLFDIDGRMCFNTWLTPVRTRVIHVGMFSIGSWEKGSATSVLRFSLIMQVQSIYIES